MVLERLRSIAKQAENWDSFNLDVYEISRTNVNLHCIKIQGVNSTDI